MFLLPNLALILIATVEIASGRQPKLTIKCDTIPPSMWCSNTTLASRCGFAKLCDIHNRAVFNQKINLTLFYESKCGGCQKMITQVLYPQVFQLLGEFVRIELVPYGNAKIVNGTIVCQHGDEECRINKYESCAIHHLAMNNRAMPYINCIEDYMMSHNDDPDAFNKSLVKCSEFLGPNATRKIQKCFTSSEGIALQRRAAQRTASAFPDAHKWVPWLLVNNVSEKSIQAFGFTSLPALLCSWFVGDHVPQYCQGFGASNESLLIKKS